MTPVLIDLSNFETHLKQSQASRDGARTGPLTLTVVAVAKTISRGSGSFITDGFKVGQSIQLTGFTNAGNNTTKTIESVTALVITVTSATGLVNETGGGDEEVDAEPTGNIYFDTLNGRIELITASELASIDFGSGAEANPLTDALGIKFEALYAFERQERQSDEELRKFDSVAKATFKFAGAYETINGRKFADNDRQKLRGSGWIERNSAGLVDRIYFGVKSLGNIESGSQPYYQLSVDTGSAALQIDVVAAAGTFTRTTGDFLADGFKPGQTIVTSGFTNAGNNTTKVISTVTTTVITVTLIAGLVNETGSGNERVKAESAPGVPVNFAKVGSIDEAVQVFGTTANGDATAGDFTKLTYLTNKVRTFGFNYDEKTLVDSGVSEMSGYSTGFALGETPHLTTGDYSLADVYGGAQIAPWTGMTLEKLAVPQTETGFAEADGDFTWVLHNASGGTLDECVAFLDALAQTDNDIDSGALTVTRGKRVSTWYTYNGAGQIVTRSGALDGLGLFIEGLPVADQQRVTFTDDASNIKTYPWVTEVVVSVGANAAADANAWYHAFYSDGSGSQDFNNALAVTVNDADGNPVKGLVSGLTEITFSYDYDGNTQAGLAAGVNKDIVFLCEGDGGATQAKTTITITRITTVSASCVPSLETNV